jgi:hypothetical protein
MKVIGMKSFGPPIAMVGDCNSIEHASALRAALEVFRLRVDLYRMVQRRHLLAFLAGQRIPYDYTVLGGHGTGPDDAPKLIMEVVDQVAGDHEADTGWEPVLVELTPQTIPKLVHATGGTLVCGGCGAGRPPLADAFLAAGYDAYIGAVQPYIDAESAFLFTVGFFYFALGEDRGPDAVAYSDAEAVERAAALDPEFRYGTKWYRYYSRR